MNKAPAFQFYPKDWMDFKVQRMSYEAQGIYMKLLCFMWNDSKDQCSILNDDNLISKSLGISKKKWLKIKEEFFYKNDPIFLLNGNKIISPRLRKEIRKIRTYKKQQAEKGKKSGAVRRKRKRTAVEQRFPPVRTKREPNANQTRTKTKSSSSSSSSYKKDKSKDLSCSENGKKYKFEESHKNLAKLLESKILERMPKLKFRGKDYLDRWANEARLMEEKKEATIEEMEKLIIWIYGRSAFWSKNILSFEKFRKQFGRLWADMEDSGPPASQIGKSTKKITPEKKAAKDAYLEARKKKEQELWNKKKERAESIRKKQDKEAWEELNREIDDQLRDWTADYYAQRGQQEGDGK